MTIIDRDSPVPLYFQLKQILLEKIAAGNWKAGEVIPSEQDLQDTYGLSRTTVRQTLSELVFEGHLVRQRGRGTFIAHPKIAHNPGRSIQLNEYMDQQGVKLSWRVVEQGWVSLPSFVCAQLGIESEEKGYRILRLRLADGAPFGYHMAFLPVRFAKQINFDSLEDGSSLDYISHLPQMKNVRVHRTIEAVLADEMAVQLLDAPKDSATLQLDRLVVAEDQTPVEFMRAVFRGDRFKYQITL